MKKYKDLDLAKIREEHGLDFAHYTFQPGQCSCCYGPMQQPGAFWRGGKRPVYHPKSRSYTLGGKPFDTENMRYILFENADDGSTSGCVDGEDVIENYTYVKYQLRDLEEVEKISEAIAEQLDDDYAVLIPENEKDYEGCVVIYMIERFFGAVKSDFPESHAAFVEKTDGAYLFRLEEKKGAA